MKTRLCLMISALVLSLLAAACQSSGPVQPLYPPPFPKEMVKDLWQAATTSTPIVIDGTLEEAWKTAPVKTVWVRDAIDFAYQYPVFLRALYDNDYVYISAQWPDSAEDSLPHRYVWNQEQLAYEPSDEAEDMFAIEFQLTGRMITSMLTTKDYTSDVWQWKAGRGNRAGYADDKRHIISSTPIEGGHAFDLYDGSRCWIARPADAGTAPYRSKSPPLEFTSHRYEAAFEEIPATGSRGDVLAKGMHHDGKHWSLEMKRKLNTGTDDDVIFRMQEDLPVAIAVFRNQRDIQHAVSDVMYLRFKAPVSNR